jgi:hypothetical protein
MEGSWRLKPSLFVGVGYCKEEGTPLSGSRRTCAIVDLSGSWWRRHTLGCLCVRDSSLGQGEGRVCCRPYTHLQT